MGPHTSTVPVVLKMHVNMSIDKSNQNAILAKIANLRKVVRMLKIAIEKLGGGDSPATLEHCQYALTAAETEISTARANLTSVPKARQQKAGTMPRDKSTLIREDGTLRYVVYMKKSGKRPDVVAIIFRGRGLPPLNTSFTLANRDINEVYRIAVLALARHVGVIDDAPLVESLLATSKAFQIHYGLE